MYFWMMKEVEWIMNVLEFAMIFLGERSPFCTGPDC
jgi:hypothetical protein